MHQVKTTPPVDREDNDEIGPRLELQPGAVVAYVPAFATLVNSVKGGLLLSQAVWYQNRCTSPDGFWCITCEQWQQATGMTRHEVESARESCSEFLISELRGMPAKTYYKLHCRKVANKAPSVCRFLANNLYSTKEIKNNSITPTTSTVSPEKVTKRDEAIALVRAARELFAFYPKSNLDKFNKSEVQAAEMLLRTLNRDQVLSLMRAAKQDKWGPTRARVGDFSTMLRNLGPLLAQFNAVLEEVKVSNPSFVSGIKSVEEVRAEWHEYLTYCEKTNQQPLPELRAAYAQTLPELRNAHG